MHKKRRNKYYDTSHILPWCMSRAQKMAFGRKPFSMKLFHDRAEFDTFHACTKKKKRSMKKRWKKLKLQWDGNDDDDDVVVVDEGLCCVYVCVNIIC
jgi:hypothetical protein